MRKLFAFCVVVSLLGIFGCGGGSGSNTDPIPAAQLAGNWAGNWQITNNSGDPNWSGLQGTATATIDNNYGLQGTLTPVSPPSNAYITAATAWDSGLGGTGYQLFLPNVRGGVTVFSNVPPTLDSNGKLTLTGSNAAGLTLTVTMTKQ